MTVNADADHYGTWLVGATVIHERVIDRTIILQLSTERSASGREIYGDIRYQVRVRRGNFVYTSLKYWMHDTSNDQYYYLISNDSKLNGERQKDAEWTQGTAEQLNADNPDSFTSATDPSSVHEYFYCESRRSIQADSEWQKPTVTKNPYAFSDNYFDADSGPQKNRCVTAYATYTQIMPLYYTDARDAQNAEYNLMNTPYFFDVRCFNERGGGDWYSGADNWSQGHDGFLVTALCSNLVDFVKANAAEKSAVLEELSALCARLGEITDGSLFASILNYWILTTKRGATKPEDYQGAFRVGGTDEYILVTPKIENGTVVGYSITIKAGDISFSSSGVDLASGTYIYDDNDKALRLHLTARGITIQHKINPLGDWTASNVAQAGTMQIRTSEYNGTKKTSLVITNDPDAGEFGVEVPGVTAYHFSGSVLDENGNDPKGLGLASSLLDPKEGYILLDGAAGGSYGGPIRTAQEAQSVALHKMGSMYVNGSIVDETGTVTASPSKSYNDAASTEWGLTAQQVSARIFTPEEVQNG